MTTGSTALRDRTRGRIRTCVPAWEERRAVAAPDRDAGRDTPVPESPETGPESNVVRGED